MSNETVGSPSLSLSRRGVLGLGASAAAIAAASAWLPRTARAESAVAGTLGAADETLNTQNPIIYRFKIGSIEATAISDAQLSIKPVGAVWPDVKPDEMQAVLRANFKSTEAFQPEVNVLVLKKGGDTVLIDSGAGGKSARLMAGLRQAGIKPEQINLIAITHLHGDHFGGLSTEGGTAAFPGARVAINKTEVEYWQTMPSAGDLVLDEKTKAGWVQGAQNAIKVATPKLDKVKGGDKPLPWLEFVDTAGHTPGHSSLNISDGADKLMIFGDVGHHPVFTFQKPEWTISFDYSKKEAVATRKKVLAQLAADRTRVMAYHMPWPGIGYVKKTAEAYEWVAEDWAW